MEIAPVITHIIKICTWDENGETVLFLEVTFEYSNDNTSLEDDNDDWMNTLQSILMNQKLQDNYLFIPNKNFF